MDLSDKMLAKTAKIGIEIRQVRDVVHDTIIAARTGGRVSVAVPSELASELKEDDYFMRVLQEDVIKLVVGPLDPEGFYFFQREARPATREGLIAYSPNLEVRVETVQSTGKGTPQHIYFKESGFMGLIDPEGSEGQAYNFVNRLNREDKILTVKLDGREYFFYGPVEWGKLWIPGQE